MIPRTNKSGYDFVFHNLRLEMPVPSQGHYSFYSFPVVD